MTERKGEAKGEENQGEWREKQRWRKEKSEYIECIKKVKTTFLWPEIHSALWGQEEEDSERQMGEETLRIV